MNTVTFQLECRDPIVARDGRPFGASQGYRMKALPWLLPSVMAGACRTVVGTSASKSFTPAEARDLLEVEIAGPFPVSNGILYLPAPQDCVVPPNGKPLRAAPRYDVAGGCDWPAEGLVPVMLDGTHEDFKPEPPPAWWPVSAFTRWLLGEPVTFDDNSFLCPPEVDQRLHVSLERSTGAARDEHLFATAALPLTQLRRYQPLTGQTADQAGPAANGNQFAGISLAARLRGNGWCADSAAHVHGWHPLGGERRLVHWQADPSSQLWGCPEQVVAKLRGSRQVRMTLLTPAIFAGGWKPGWLNNQLVGTPPQANVTLKLQGVCIDRWRAVSGWSFQKIDDAGRLDPQGNSGPKPVKRTVPAGGTYFFEVSEGAAEQLAERWFESVCDDEQDRRNGFGLAAWGIW